MNILDENVADSQQSLLRKKRVRLRQIGQDLGRKGMKDDELIPLLHQLDRPTFFTLDGDFYDRRLRHEGYCLVHLDDQGKRITPGNESSNVPYCPVITSICASSSCELKNQVMTGRNSTRRGVWGVATQCIFKKLILF